MNLATHHTAYLRRLLPAAAALLAGVLVVIAVLAAFALSLAPAQAGDSPWDRRGGTVGPVTPRS